LTSESLASSPLTKVGESSVESEVARATPSEIATPSGNSFAVDDLPCADSQDGPVHGRHPLDRPTLAVGRQQLVDRDPLVDHAPDDLDAVLVQRVLGHRLLDPLRKQRLGVDPALLSLEQDVQRALSRFGACRHLS